MKKFNIFTALALTILFIGSVQAQTSIILTPEVGIHSSKTKPSGDMDISSNWQGMDVNYSGIFSYQGGLGVGIQFFGNWGLITGIKYNRKGGKVTVETRDLNNPFRVFQNETDTVGVFDVGEFTITTKHNWLSIPILIRGQFGGAFKVGIALGPQINMAIGKYKETIDFNMEKTNVSSQEFEEEFGKNTNHVFKKSHLSMLVLPYVSYEMNDNSSIKLSAMIEAGANMLNDNLAIGVSNGVRKVRGTMRNTQIGIMLSYEHRFNFKTGVKY